MKKSRILLLAALALLFLSAVLVLWSSRGGGATTTLYFRVLDSASCRPIEGAEITRTRFSRWALPFFGTFVIDRKTVKTDANGCAAFTEVPNGGSTLTEARSEEYAKPGRKPDGWIDAPEIKHCFWLSKGLDSE